MTKPATLKYHTTNWPAYNAALKACGSLRIWFDKDMAWFADKNGKRSRSQTFSDAAIQFCPSIKCLFGLSLWQSIGMVGSLLKQAGLDWPVSDFSTGTCPEFCVKQAFIVLMLIDRFGRTALSQLKTCTAAVI